MLEGTSVHLWSDLFFTAGSPESSELYAFGSRKRLRTERPHQIIVFTGKKCLPSSPLFTYFNYCLLSCVFPPCPTVKNTPLSLAVILVGAGELLLGLPKLRLLQAEPALLAQPLQSMYYSLPKDSL